MNAQGLTSLRDELLTSLSRVVGSGEVLSDAHQALIAQQLEWLTGRIDALRVEERETPPPIPPQTQETAALLWQLSGGNPEAFTSYLDTFPDPSLRALLTNPQQLQSVIENLQRLPIPEMGESQGIPEGPIPSSNVYGFSYDPKSQRLMVKFNGKDEKEEGPIYAYDGIPPKLFQLIQSGAVPAKTSGSNKYGSWWVNKMPSLGATVNQMLVKGGFPYKKIT